MTVFRNTFKKICSLSANVTGMRNTSTTSKVLDVKGQSVNVVISGEGPHPLLLMPGALGTAETDFGPQIQGLNKSSFTVIGWDPPGYGKSRPPSRNFDNFFHRDAELSIETMKCLGFESFSLLGWSDGGITAMIAAARHPDAVRKLVVWGANAYIVKSDMEMIEAVQDVSKWSDRMRAPMEAIYGDSFPNLWSSWCEAYRKYYDAGGDICKEDLNHIRAPTLIIHGAKDAMVAGEHVHFLHNNIKDSEKFIFEDGKHNLHFKYKEEFNEMVDNFLIK